MKPFLHIALSLVILTAYPFVGNSQRLPAKLVKSVNNLPRVQPIVPIKLNVQSLTKPPVVKPFSNSSYKFNESPKTSSIFGSVKPFQVPIVPIDSTVIVEIRQCHLAMNQLNRMRDIIEKSNDRVENLRSEWLSLNCSRDRSFVYEEYRYEKARLQMLVNIFADSIYSGKKAEALMLMEEIPNREPIVLPYVKIDLPRCVESNNW